MRKRHGARPPAPEYKGNAAVIKDIKTEEVQVETEREVAELIGTTVEDLSWLPFGVAGVMFMSQSKQMDDDLSLNRNATMLAKKMMHPDMSLGVRGDVVIFRESPPWGRLPGDTRPQP